MPINRVSRLTLILLVISLIVGGLAFFRMINAKETYLTQTLLSFKETGGATSNISDTSSRVSSADISLKQGAAQVEKEHDKLTGIRKKMDDDIPPLGFVEFHRHFLKALKIYEKASDKLALGYRLNDDSNIKDALVIWPKGKAELDLAFEKLREPNRARLF